MTVVHIDTATAEAALRAAAFTIDDPTQDDHGRTVVHTFLGAIGADWDLDDALLVVEHNAAEVAWASNILGHDLAIRRLSDGKVIRFAVRAPEGVL